DCIRSHFDLDDDHVYLHALMGGAISDEQKTVFAVVEEANYAGSKTSEPSDEPGQREEALRSHLAHHVPAYMIPSTFVFIDTLPLTRNGKVDRRALPEPSDVGAAQSRGAEQVSPETEAEEAILTVWADVLGVESAGVTDDFFDDLGGTSLQAIRLVTALRRNLGVDVPITAPYESPTVRQLAAALGEVVPSAPTQNGPNATEDQAETLRRLGI
ncbi:phosphopantetheine-binding protein, partial [Longibacter sp.]|uniref:phosphopantetheine-binding protein n=1 Tax=Longibacter sp. TaxID=2045415 RepID=UPI003EB8617F